MEKFMDINFNGIWGPKVTCLKCKTVSCTKEVFNILPIGLEDIDDGEGCWRLDTNKIMDIE